MRMAAGFKGRPGGLATAKAAGKALKTGNKIKTKDRSSEAWVWGTGGEVVLAGGLAHFSFGSFSFWAQAKRK
jgi:hypothetical protein